MVKSKLQVIVYKSLELITLLKVKILKPLQSYNFIKYRATNKEVDEKPSVKSKIFLKQTDLKWCSANFNTVLFYKYNQTRWSNNDS